MIIKSQKYNLLKFIRENEPVCPQQVADEFYSGKFHPADKDLKILKSDLLIYPHEGTENNIEFYDLTIKGKEYLDVFKERLFHFWLPLIISVCSLAISLFALFQ
ncbi:MAG: hypothetical protein KHX58_04075 [Coprobacillus sp.]|nr:hypothetical protein [Coprobacillus sp.]